MKRFEAATKQSAINSVLQAPGSLVPNDLIHQKEQCEMTQVILDRLVGVVLGETFFLLRFTPPYGVLSPRSMFLRTLSSLGYSTSESFVFLTRVVTMVRCRTASSFFVERYPDTAERCSGAGVQSQHLFWKTETNGLSLSKIFFFATTRVTRCESWSSSILDIQLSIPIYRMDANVMSVQIPDPLCPTLRHPELDLGWKKHI